MTLMADPTAIPNFGPYLDSISQRTWQRLAQGSQTGLTQGEETFTDWNLLDVRLQFPNGVIATKWSHYDEARSTGADWDWWIQGSAGWAGFRIQAKKLDFPSQTYPSIDHTNKYGRQIDMLISSSVAAGMTPTYCFYNSSTGPSPSYGCALADASNVKPYVDAGAKDYATYLGVSVPWSVLGNISVPLEDRHRALTGQGGLRAGSAPVLHRDPPAHVAALLRGERLEAHRLPDVSALFVTVESRLV